MPGRSQGTCLGYAGLCLALALSWQYLTVRYNYGDNWTALYYTGAYARVPPALAFEKIYRIPNTLGYDGMLYHFLAHDPLLQHGTSAYLDNPRLRWRRILVPGAAFLLALGQPAYIDTAFFAVILAFLSLGAYWLSRYCVHWGLHPAWGLCFALTPGAVASLDRMTLDLPLTALSVGFALYATTDPGWKLFAILAVAPLVRETGLLLTLGYCLYSIARRQWFRALGAAATVMPFLAWFLFVQQRTSPDTVVTWLSGYPLSGLLQRTLHPVQFRLTGRWLMMASALDYLAVLGIWLALVLAALVWKKSFGPVEAAVAAFTLPVLFVAKRDIWQGGYEIGRTMSPLLVLLALAGLSSRWWGNVLPLAMVAPRLLFQLKPQWDHIVFALWRAIR